MLAFVLCTAVVMDCSDGPTDLSRGRGAHARREETLSPTQTGCARLQVTVGGLDSIRVSEVTHSSTCGPLHPEIGGVPQFDHTTGITRLPIVLNNTGSRALRGPARVYGWADSLDLIDPPGLNNPHSAGYVDFRPADSSLAPSASPFGGALLWRFDTLLAPSGQPQTVAAGARSGIRWIEFIAQRGAHVFQVTLWANAMLVSSPVPAITPDSVPQDFLNALGTVTGPPLPGIYTKDLILVVFRHGSAQSERQAAIDSVEGEVIGGRRTFGDDGYYEVHITGGTTAALLAAVHKLQGLPQVDLAMWIDHRIPDESFYRKPVDGTSGWRDWRISPAVPDLSRPNWALEDIDAPLAWGCSTRRRRDSSCRD